MLPAPQAVCFDGWWQCADAARLGSHEIGQQLNSHYECRVARDGLLQKVLAMKMAKSQDKLQRRFSPEGQVSP